MEITELIARHAAGVSNRDLAEAVSKAGHQISHTGVGNWRNGINPPGSRSAATALATALKIDPSIVLESLGWMPDGPSLEDRVGRIERALMRAGIDLDPSELPLGEDLEQAIEGSDASGNRPKRVERPA